MPRRECAEDGCRVLCEGPRCPKHTRGDNYVKQRDRARKEHDPLRKLYGTQRWRRTRMEALVNSPICQRCNAAMATVADHVIPARIYAAQDEEKFFDLSNIQALCDAPPNSCHHQKTRDDIEKYGLVAKTW